MLERLNLNEVLIKKSELPRRQTFRAMLDVKTCAPVQAKAVNPTHVVSLLNEQRSGRSDD
jgi:hypothetical protein